MTEISNVTNARFISSSIRVASNARVNVYHINKPQLVGADFSTFAMAKAACRFFRVKVVF